MNVFPNDKQTCFLMPGVVGDLEMMTTHPSMSGLPYVAVICHPHPQYQGTMHNKVVTTLARAVMPVMPTVRFNFRGVQKSTGEYADGIGEQADLQAVLDWVKTVLPHHRLLLMGFSFGGYVAASVANRRHDIDYLCTVAPALRMGDFSKMISVSCPWFVVYGDQDEVVSVSELADLVAHPPTAHLHGEVIAGASHFFHGQLLQLQQVVTSHLQTCIPAVNNVTGNG